MATVDHARFEPRRPISRGWPSAICGCTSRAWAPTARPTCRSSSAATAATCGTRRATATSTASRALFCVNIGHGHTEVAQAGADQAHELDFFTTWSYAHPRAIELAAQDRVADPGRPQPHLLHLRRQRGGRDRRQARPPVPQGHRQPEQAQGHRAGDRLPRHHHGRARGDRHPRAAPSVRAVHARRRARPEHEPVPAGRRDGGRGPGRDGRPRDRVPGPRHGRGGDHGAGPERRRLLRAARGLLPARARDLRRVQRALHLRRGDLLVGPPGRVVRLPALRLPARHHHHGEGDHQRLRADGRDDRLATGSPSRSWRARPRSCTA